MGLTETCRILGWPETKRSTLHYWRKGVVPLVARWKAKSCIELGYGIGVLYDGDGSVSKSESWHKYVIQLNTIDKELGEVFSRSMTRLLGVNYHEPWWYEKEKEWRVVYKSKAFYTWYKKCEEQGLEGFKPYIEYNKETVRYYLKGLFDSEGNNYRNKQIFLCNSDIKLLRYIQCLLEKYFDIVATGPYLQKKAGTKTVINEIETRYNNDYYYISINRKEHVQNFLDENRVQYC